MFLRSTALYGHNYLMDSYTNWRLLHLYLLAWTVAHQIDEFEFLL